MVNDSDTNCRSCSELLKNPKRLPLHELSLEERRFVRNSTVDSVAKDEVVTDAMNKTDLGNLYKTDIIKIPAIDAYWLDEAQIYNEFQTHFPQLGPKANSKFAERNRKFLGNVADLLDCTFQKFWCHLVHEPRVSRLLQDFLHYHIRLHSLKYLDEASLALYNDVYERVGYVYHRMLDCKESEVEYLPAQVAADFLIQRKIITMNTVIILSSMYSRTDRSLVDKVLEFYFTHSDPAKYADEMREFLGGILSEFERIGAVVFNSEDPSGEAAQSLVEDTMDPDLLFQIASNLLDIAATFNSFAAVCPEVVDLGIETDLPLHLSCFYHKIYPKLYKDYRTRKVGTERDKPFAAVLLDRFALGRHEFVSCYHHFVSHLVDLILTTQNKSEQHPYLETFLKLLTAALDDEVFVRDYHASHSVENLLQTMSVVVPDLDQDQVNYLLKGLSTVLDTPCNLLSAEPPSLDADAIFDSTFAAVRIKPKPSKPLAADRGGASASSAAGPERLGEADVQQRIAAVLDMFPELGDGYVLKCLEAYDYDTARLTEAILEDNLPPHIRDLPTDLIRIPPDTRPADSVLLEEHVGKRLGLKETIHLLDDRSDFDRVKDFILNTGRNYENEDDFDERDYVPAEPSGYGKSDAESTYRYLDKSVRREFCDVVTDPSSSEDEEEEDGGGRRRQPGDFCEDPAAMRARREAQLRHGGRGGRAAAKPAAQAPRDVVGKARGQGQDKNVQINRDKKNVNKSSRANHNRKGGAQWKRSRGMMPM